MRMLKKNLTTDHTNNTDKKAKIKAKVRALPRESGFLCGPWFIFFGFPLSIHLIRYKKFAKKY
ncbi:hypothetical protein FACS189479_00360 [Spirochaetia bacterium]|nr:hypothetical protein FACS189479_00360 [Spirochaetia bacterium]